MKKTILFGTAAIIALAMSSCKSGESAYKKAYEKSQAQEAAAKPAEKPAETTAPVAVTPVETTTTTETTAIATPDYSNVSVRTEDVSLVSGSGLKAYSVVVGSFGIETNAVNLQNKLKEQGYDAQVAKSTENMYRVIISTHNEKAAAAQMRDKVISQYQGAWLLYKK